MKTVIIAFVISILVIPSINFSPHNDYSFLACADPSAILDEDIIPPSVISVKPHADEHGAFVNCKIEITFSEPMNKNATETSFSLSPAITGIFSWIDAQNKMVFTPEEDFSIDTRYTIVLNSSIAQDASGNLLDGNWNGIHDLGNTWFARTNMPTKRSSLTTAVLNNRIYAIGGRNSWSGPPTNLVEVYDPVNDSWSTGTPMLTPRSGFGSGVLNNKIYAVGGYNSYTGVFYNNVEEYDPVTDVWTAKAPISVARRGLSVCVVNNRLFAIGGQTQGYVYIRLIEEYDSVNNTWTTKNTMPYSVYYSGTAAANGKIYAIAGAVRQTQEYDPVADSWAVKQVPITDRVGLGAGSVSGKVYAIGGSDLEINPLSKNEEYNPITNIWSTKANMPTARWDLSVCSLGGSVYAIGGDNTGGYNSANEMYIVNDDFISSFVTGNSTQDTFQIPITSGWNLVSLPLVQSDTSVEAALNSITGQWDVIKHYDGVTKTWNAYRVGSTANTLFHLDHTMGFWLHALQNTTLTVTGQHPAETNILLSAGWNLVGYPTLNETVTVAIAFQGTDADRFEINDPASPYLISEVQPAYIMKPGEGYWVRVPADTVWIVNG